MANRRMITSDIWQDDLIGRLTFFERLIFISLITCADDQGRMLNNPIIILAHGFPLDRNLKLEQVTSALEKIVKSGKVLAYEAEGYPLLQIVNWWKHQTPSWASPSKFPPPAGWTDRVKCHAAGNEIEARNWEQRGGFSKELRKKLYSQQSSQLHSQLHSQQPNTIDEGEGKNEAEVESNNDSPLLPLSAAFVEATKIPELIGGEKKWVEALAGMHKAGITPEDLTTAIRELQAKPHYKIAGPWSVHNAAVIVMQRRLSGNGRLSLEDYTYGGS